MDNREKKPYLLVDSSYVSFHRFFATLIWFVNVYPHIEIEDDYDWTQNEIFMKHFDETYMKNLLKFKNMYNIPNENMIIVRDCPRETIWRMNLYPKYKGTRKNTCSYRNKRYNVGNVFRHIYNSLYPKLEKQYGFRLMKVDNAEADDVIAVLAKQIREIDPNRLVIIISNDNDYLQLVNDKTLIWSLQNRLLNTKVEMTAEEILLKKILRGDESDNIPSIVGSMPERVLDELVTNEELLEQWLEENGKKEVFEENRKLIDFRYIPEELKALILNKITENIPEIGQVLVNEETGIKEYEKSKGLLVDFPQHLWKNVDKIKSNAKNVIKTVSRYNGYSRNYGYLGYNNYGISSYVTEQFYS
jgi:5'-3' exonuclease